MADAEKTIAEATEGLSFLRGVIQKARNGPEGAIDDEVARLKERVAGEVKHIKVVDGDEKASTLKDFAEAKIKRIDRKLNQIEEKEQDALYINVSKVVLVGKPVVENFGHGLAVATLSMLDMSQSVLLLLTVAAMVLALKMVRPDVVECFSEVWHGRLERKVKRCVSELEQISDEVTRHNTAAKFVRDQNRFDVGCTLSGDSKWFWIDNFGAECHSVPTTRFVETLLYFGSLYRTLAPTDSLRDARHIEAKRATESMSAFAKAAGALCRPVFTKAEEGGRSLDSQLRRRGESVGKLPRATTTPIGGAKTGSTDPVTTPGKAKLESTRQLHEHKVPHRLNRVIPAWTELSGGHKDLFFNAVSKVVDNNDDGHVSPLEFATFLAYFGPLRYCYNRSIDSLIDWKHKRPHPWFTWKAYSSAQIRQKLVTHGVPFGTFIIRASSSQRNQLVLSFRNYRSRPRNLPAHKTWTGGDRHYLIKNNEEGFSLTGATGNSQGLRFESLGEVVKHFRNRTVRHEGKEVKVLTQHFMDLEQYMTVVVSGESFPAPLGLFLEHEGLENTRLYQDIHDHHCQENFELKYSRDPRVFSQVILNWYRTGEYHIPSSIPRTLVMAEAEYWGLPPLPGGSFNSRWSDPMLAERFHNRFSEVPRDMRGVHLPSVLVPVRTADPGPSIVTPNPKVQKKARTFSDLAAHLDADPRSLSRELLRVSVVGPGATPVTQTSTISVPDGPPPAFDEPPQAVPRLTTTGSITRKVAPPPPESAVVSASKCDMWTGGSLKSRPRRGGSRYGRRYGPRDIRGRKDEALRAAARPLRVWWEVQVDPWCSSSHWWSTLYGSSLHNTSGNRAKTPNLLLGEEFPAREGQPSTCLNTEHQQLDNTRVRSGEDSGGYLPRSRPAVRFVHVRHHANGLREKWASLYEEWYELRAETDVYQRAVSAYRTDTLPQPSQCSNKVVVSEERMRRMFPYPRKLHGLLAAGAVQGCVERGGVSSDRSAGVTQPDLAKGGSMVVSQNASEPVPMLLLSRLARGPSGHTLGRQLSASSLKRPRHLAVRSPPKLKESVSSRNGCVTSADESTTNQRSTLLTSGTRTGPERSDCSEGEAATQTAAASWFGRVAEFDENCATVKLELQMPRLKPRDTPASSEEDSDEGGEGYMDAAPALSSDLAKTLAVHPGSSTHDLGPVEAPRDPTRTLSLLPARQNSALSGRSTDGCSDDSSDDVDACGYMDEAPKPEPPTPPRFDRVPSDVARPNLHARSRARQESAAQPAAPPAEVEEDSSSDDSVAIAGYDDATVLNARSQAPSSETGGVGARAVEAQEVAGGGGENTEGVVTGQAGTPEVTQGAAEKSEDIAAGIVGKVEGIIQGDAKSTATPTDQSVQSTAPPTHSTTSVTASPVRTTDVHATEGSIQDQSVISGAASVEGVEEVKGDMHVGGYSTVDSSDLQSVRDSLDEYKNDESKKDESESAPDPYKMEMATFSDVETLPWFHKKISDSKAAGGALKRSSRGTFLCRPSSYSKGGVKCFTLSYVHKAGVNGKPPMVRHVRMFVYAGRGFSRAQDGGKSGKYPMHKTFAQLLEVDTMFVDPLYADKSSE